MVNPLRKFFNDIGKRLGLWNDSGVPTPQPIPQPPPQQSNQELPPFLRVSGGGSSQYDNEIRWHKREKTNPAYWEVGSQGRPPEVDAVRDMLNEHNRHHPDAQFVSLMIGGDEVKGDTGGLGGGPQHRGYVVQKDDLESYLDQARDMNDLANMIAPPGHGWEGAFKIGFRDYELKRRDDK